MKLPFERSEFLERADRTKHRMQDLAAEVLLVTDPANMYWLTGYKGD